MTAEREGLAEALTALADEFASNVDWSNGRSNYGDNEAWESAARQVRELADALADLLAARDRRVRGEALREELLAIRTHNLAPVTPDHLRYAATHEALNRSWIFDVLTGLADRIESTDRPSAKEQP